MLEPLELFVVFDGGAAAADFFPPECLDGGGESDAVPLASIWQWPSKNTPFSTNSEGVLMFPLTRPGL